MSVKTERQSLASLGGGSDATAVARRWMASFPYQWEADDLVSRRHLLHLAVFTSGALFLSTLAIAILGLLRRGAEHPQMEIVRANAVMEGQAHYFAYPEPDDQAVLLHLAGGEFVAFSQKCTHLSCSVLYQPGRERLFCPCHEGVFNRRTGAPEAGPPLRRLPQIELRRQGDVLFAVGMRP